MKLFQLALVLPTAFFSFSLMLASGCGGRTENTVVEAEPMTAEEEAVYEQESYGSSDESQN